MLRIKSSQSFITFFSSSPKILLMIRGLLGFNTQVPTPSPRLF